MKAETLLEMMESKQYESLTVSEFAKIVRDTMNKFEEKIMSEGKVICHDDGETEFEFDDEEYDKASSNKGELI